MLEQKENKMHVPLEMDGGAREGMWLEQRLATKPDTWMSHMEQKLSLIPTCVSRANTGLQSQIHKPKSGVRRQRDHGGQHKQAHVTPLLLMFSMATKETPSTCLDASFIVPTEHQTHLSQFHQTETGL